MTSVLRISLIVILMLGDAPLIAQVCINEFMASNGAYWDNDKQAYSDWIELYNAGDDTVQLSGYFLTDNLDRLKKWKIPEGVAIGPKAHILFWADGKNHGMHTNFNLSIRTESLGLSDATGKPVDTHTYLSQRRDVSFGREEDGSGAWVFFEQHTAGGTNNWAPRSESGKRASRPSFSLNGGFYKDKQKVELTSVASGDIKYTLDGSDVNYESEIYKEPILITSTTTLRAKLYTSYRLASYQVTETYFIGLEPKLPIISITTDPKNLWDRDMGIYVNGTNYVKDKWYTANYLKYWRRPSNIEFFEADGSLGFNASARIKIFGIYTSQYGQKPLTLYFNDVVNHKIFPNRDTYNYQTLVVRNSGQDWIRTLICDGLVNSLVINSLDLDAQAYRPAVVYINGKYWGINNIREKLDESYIFERHGTDPSNVLLKGRNNSKKVTEYNELIAYATNESISLNERCAYIAEHIDVNEFLNYQMTEIYSANRDWPNNNMKVWKRKGDSKWRWVLVDLDVSFGIWNNTQPHENTLQRATDPAIINTELLSVLLDNEYFKNDFIQRVALSLNTIFSAERVNHFIDSLASDIRHQIPNHVERWKDSCSWSCGIESVEFWEHYLNKLRYFADHRMQFMREHLTQKFKLTGLSELTIKAENGRVVLNELDWPFNPSGLYFNNVPMSLVAIPKPGYKFVRWKGGLHGDSPRVEITLEGPLTLEAEFEPDLGTLLPMHITENTVLDKQGSPYYAVGNITVNPGVLLSAEAGIKILMPEKGHLIIKGGLNFRGAKGDSIEIAANSGAGSTSWGAICLDSASLPVMISYTVVKDATHGEDKRVYVGAVGGHHSDLTIHDSRIDDVFGQPVYTEYGSTAIRYTKMHTKISSDIVNVKYGKAIIEYCDLQGNNQPNSDGIDYDNIVDGIIRGNNIYNFTGGNSDGIDLGEGAIDVFIDKNRIVNCSDKGISVGQKSTAKIFRNVIIGCNQGVGIKDSSSFAIIDKCVFYRNNIAIAVFEKNNNHGGGDARVTNTIISQSKNASVQVDEYSSLDITYSLSDMDLMKGEGNLYADPMFQSPGTGEFTLRDESPCLNSGTRKSFLDLGKARNQMGLGVAEKKIKVHLVYYLILGALGMAGMYAFGK